jgi:hypothetical protein
MAAGDRLIGAPTVWDCQLNGSGTQKLVPHGVSRVS